MRAETENDLIQQARAAISSCNWEVGRLASLWTERFARGRGDAEFGALVGLSREHIAQRRAVWNRFGGQRDSRRSLSWSHYRAAVSWDDAESFLDWAQKIGATRDEMANYRAAASGESAEAATDGEPAEQVQESPRRSRAVAPVGAAEEEGEAPTSVSASAETATAAPQQDRRGESPQPAGPVPRTITIGQILSDLREWSAQAGVHQKARIAEEIIIAAVALVPASARERRPLLDALLGELAKTVPEDQFAEIGSSLAQWGEQFGGFALSAGEDKQHQSLPGSISAHQEVMLEWNMLGEPFKQIRALTHKRRKVLASRLKNRLWRDGWRAALAIIKETDWMRGANKNQWVATFDWFLREDTVIRVLEAGVEKKGQDARSSAFDKVFTGMAAAARDMEN